MNGGSGGGPGIKMIKFANWEMNGGIGGCGGGGNLVAIGLLVVLVAPGTLLGFLPEVLLNRGIGGIIGGGGGNFSFIMYGKKFDLKAFPINWNTEDFSSAIQNLTNFFLTRK